MTRALRAWAINRKGKNSIRNLRYRPRAVVVVVVNLYLNSVKKIFSYTNSILITIIFKIKITIKTDLQDCRVGIGCFKCVVDFLLKLPN